MSSGADVVLDGVADLTRRALDATSVSLVVGGPERVTTLATVGTPTAPAVPQGWSLAHIAAASSSDMVIVADPGGPRREGLGLPDLTAPLTLVAHAVTTPSGEGIGAVEVAWSGQREVDDEMRAQLHQAITVIGQVLELRAEVSEYARFIELTPNAVAIVDSSGAIVEANPALAQLLELDGAASLPGRGFLELVARGDRTRVTAQLSRMLFTQRPSGHLTCELVTGEGRRIPCSVSVGHLRGPRRHLQLTVHDLSEQRRAQERQSQLSEQLARAQRLDAVGQIAGGLSHDLNNLLVVMVSHLALAMESLAGVASDDGALHDVQEDLREVEVAIDRAGSLTSKLLAFARQEEGVERTAHLPEVLDAVEGLLGRTLRQEVHLEISCPDSPPSLAVDPIQLERVLINLVINGRDALEGRSGSITIGVEPTVGNGADTAGNGAGGVVPPFGPDGVTIVVRDDGCGMDEATQARAFEPLFSTKHDIGGSGLGLATVLAFVEQSDGEVRLESSPGQGTTVTLWLPAVAPADAPLPVGVDVPVAGAKVLLVDPGDRTRRVISAMLTGAGYRVTAVATAEAALEVVEAEHPDLLITELALSGMPGTRLIPAARASAGPAVHRDRRGRPAAGARYDATVGQALQPRPTPAHRG